MNLVGAALRGLFFVVWVFVCLVVVFVVLFFGFFFFDGIDWTTLAVLALLSASCEPAPALLNSENARVSLSYSAGLASVVLLGPAGAAIVGASAILAWRRDMGVVKRLFNGAQFALAGC